MKGICISQINSMQSSGGARSLGSSFKKPLHILFKSGPVWSVIRQTDNDQKVGPAGHSRAGRCNALIPNTHTHTHTLRRTQSTAQPCAGSSNWLLMVYEMFSKGFIVVVVVVAFIAFIILMEVFLLCSARERPVLAQSHLVLLTCSFLINTEHPEPPLRKKKKKHPVQRCYMMATC